MYNPPNPGYNTQNQTRLTPNYELTVSDNPYDHPPYDLQHIPPPPPKQNKYRILWAIVIGIILLSFLGILLLGMQMYRYSVHNSVVPTSTVFVTHKTTVIIETPTPERATPIPTPMPTVNYYARDIYNDFVTNNLGGSDPKFDTNWSCCTYKPLGGAIVWTDE